jgi:hypothetical protein
MPAACTPSAPRASAPACEGRTLQFHGDVAKGSLEVIGSAGKAHRHELAAVDESLTKREIADWLALALNHNP